MFGLRSSVNVYIKLGILIQTLIYRITESVTFVDFEIKKQIMSTIFLNFLTERIALSSTFILIEICSYYFLSIFLHTFQPDKTCVNIKLSFAKYVL